MKLGTGSQIHLPNARGRAYLPRALTGGLGVQYLLNLRGVLQPDYLIEAAYNNSASRAA